AGGAPLQWRDLRSANRKTRHWSGAPPAMSTWDRFVETFFNAKVMVKYLPDILSGMVVTIELAVLIVLSGLLAGLVLALLRSLAADDGGGGLPRAVPAGRRRCALGRDEVRVEAMIETFFNPEIIAAIWPIVLAGLLNTVLLSLIVVPLGLLGGLILALLATLHHPLVRWPLMAWVDFFRAFP